jgi:hypothetical protein
MRYPPDPEAPFMLESGPSDSSLIVNEGSLLFHPRRDGRFPYLYSVASHPQVEEMADKTVIKNILVYIQDTEPAALKRLLDFEDHLFVPLGPDISMRDLGKKKLPIYQ